ncbi:MAG: SDR family oxidoreductase [Cytophagales bacterium]|nr:SDR family oxidoreductase [Cytophaga sp.]
MILITGANGLVGSFLCKEFIRRGYTVRALIRKHSDLTLLKEVSDQLEYAEGDINDIGSVIDAMDGVEYVVHTAAIISFWSKRQSEMFYVNVEGTKNVVDAALIKGVKRLLHISSIAAIGRKTGVSAIDERNTWEESALNTAYADTKYQAELEIYRGIEEGLNAVIVNPSVILGPALMGTSTARLFEYVQKQSTYYTEGKMNYIDVRDVVDAIQYLLLESKRSEERYILNAGMISYKDFFEQIAAALHVAAPSVKATSWMRGIVWRAEAIKAFFTGKEPLITKETARNSSTHFEYSSDKFFKEANISFRPLEDTIQWTCKSLFPDK